MIENASCIFFHFFHTDFMISDAGKSFQISKKDVCQPQKAEPG